MPPQWHAIVRYCNLNIWLIDWLIVCQFISDSVIFSQSVGMFLLTYSPSRMCKKHIGVTVDALGGRRWELKLVAGTIIMHNKLHKRHFFHTIVIRALKSLKNAFTSSPKAPRVPTVIRMRLNMRLMSSCSIHVLDAAPGDTQLIICPNVLTATLEAMCAFTLTNLWGLLLGLISLFAQRDVKRSLWHYRNLLCFVMSVAIVDDSSILPS